MAAGTAAYTLTPTGWITVGSAPSILQVQSGSVLVSVSPTEPDADDPGVSLSAGGAPLVVSGAGALWARSVRGTSRLVVATTA